MMLPKEYILTKLQGGHQKTTRMKILARSLVWLARAGWCIYYYDREGREKTVHSVSIQLSHEVGQLVKLC